MFFFARKATLHTVPIVKYLHIFCFSTVCLCFTCHEKAERVHELNEEIGKLLAKAEQLGGEGNVDEAQQLLEKVEKTRILKKEAEVSNGLIMLMTKKQSIMFCPG